MTNELSREELREHYKKLGCPGCAEAIINMIDLIKRHNMEWMYK